MYTNPLLCQDLVPPGGSRLCGYLTSCSSIYDTEMMKAVLALVFIGLATAGSYIYSNSASLENITIDGDTVTVDVGDYEAKFLAFLDFRKTYMLFGGGYFQNKNLINPIVLSGLGIVDAKRIYRRYPDFHRCKSPGAALAQPKVKHLNLIPADHRVLAELKATIAEHKENLGSDGDRVCVSLIGKTLDMRSAIVPGHDIDIQDQLPRQTFHLIDSSQRVDCRSLLD